MTFSAPADLHTAFPASITRQWYQFTDLKSADNAGANPHLIDTSTIEAVVAKYPRKGWSSCFAASMTKEMELKPWCRTTAQDGFVESIAGNELMEPYDK